METRNTEDAAVPPLFQLLLRGFEQLKPGFTNYRGVANNHIFAKSLTDLMAWQLQEIWK